MGTHPIFESDFDCLTDGLAHQGEEMYDYGSGSTDVDEPDHNDNEVHTPVDYNEHNDDHHEEDSDDHHHHEHDHEDDHNDDHDDHEDDHDDHHDEDKDSNGGYIYIEFGSDATTASISCALFALAMNL